MADWRFWLALPLLAPQALYVRRTAPRFDGAGGPTAGVVGSGDELRLVAFGDSIIAGVGAGELPDALVGQTASGLAAGLGRRVAWSAHGFSGESSSALLGRRLHALPDERADVVLVSVGVNDVTGLTTTRRWEHNLGALIGALRDRFSPAVIAFTGLPPLGVFPLLPQPLRAVLGGRARRLDRAARRIIGEHGDAIHVPVDFEPTPERFAADGYHPSEAGYREFGASMAAAIAAQLRVNADT